MQYQHGMRIKHRTGYAKQEMQVKKMAAFDNLVMHVPTAWACEILMHVPTGLAKQ